MPHVIREKACWILYPNPFSTKVPEVNDLAMELWLGVLSSKEKVTIDCIKGICIYIYIYIYIYMYACCVSIFKGFRICNIIICINC